MFTLNKQLQSVKVALVYDRVNTPIGGAEQVLISLQKLFPDSPLYTSIFHADTAYWATHFKQIKPSFLQKIPWFRTKHRLLAALMPLAFESFNLDEADIIISITSAEAKGVITKPNQLHICYLLSPPRYLYSHYHDYVKTIPYVLQPVARIALTYLKKWDLIASSRPDVIIPISHTVANRVKEFYPKVIYSKLHPVIYPPIPSLDTEKNLTSKTFASTNRRDKNETIQSNHSASHYCESNLNERKQTVPKKPYLLFFGRLVAYKRCDLVIKAGIKLKMPVVIIGNGPAKKSLQKIANNNPLIQFLPHCSNTKLKTYIHRSAAVVFPAEEDFGISHVQTVYENTPLITHKNSGATELISHQVYGNSKYLFCIPISSVNAICTAIQKMQKNNLATHSQRANMNIDTKNITKYDELIFLKTVLNTVSDLWKGHNEST